MKGGYKIIDFKNVSLSGTPVTMTDVLVDLLNNYDKVVLLSNVVLSGSAKDDCFSTVLSDGAGGVKLNCYDGYISITSEGAVTYTVVSASDMSEDIAELQGDLDDTNDMIAPAWSATVTYTKNAIVRDGGKLYKAKSNVPTGTVTSNTTYWASIGIGGDLSTIFGFYGLLDTITNPYIGTTIDLNTILNTSIIYIGENATHTPSWYSFIITLKSIVSEDGLQFCLPIFFDQRFKIFERIYTGSTQTWTEWKQINKIPE